MKAVSMFWIIVYHRYEGFVGMVPNRSDYVEWTEKWYSAYASMGYIAVQTFFFMSGVLLSYSFIRSNSSKQKKFNIFHYYLHRYLRLTPALAALYFVQVTVARRIGSGPLWSSLFEGRRSDCIDYWWAFFLYINNYIQGDMMCLSHSWYIAIDIQFYLVSPLLLLPLIKFQRKRVYAVAVILLALAIANTHFVEDYFTGTGVKLQNKAAFLLNIPTWLIGIIFGALFYDYQQEKEKYQIKNKFVIVILWMTSLGMMLFVLLYKNYAGIWGLCLCWITFACTNGHGVFINWFLSLPTFEVLAKLSYSTYLVHVTVLMAQAGYARSFPYFSDHEGIGMSMADIVISTIVGALWALAFEYPGMTIDRLIFREKKSG